MNDLNSYIKQKLKAKNMKLNTFIKNTEMSKSTIYRVMKGLQRPSDELVDKFAEILNLNPIEKREMIYYINLSESGEDATAARNAIFRLLYREFESTESRIELVFYEKGEKYIRYFDDILEKVLEKTDLFDYECNINIVNCHDLNIVKPIVRLASSLEKDGQEYSIEHLVKISSENTEYSTETISHIIPFLNLKNYNLEYTEVSGIDTTSLVENFIFLEVKYSEDENIHTDNYYFSFMEENLSACYLVDGDSNFNDFFSRNYANLKKVYSQALNNHKSYDTFGDVTFKLEKEHETYVFKTDPCYSRIPLEVYNGILNRLTPDEKNTILNSIVRNYVPSASTNDALSTVIDYLQTRMTISREHRQVDVFTRSRLEKFVETGILSDHIEGLPPFSKSDVEAILKNIKSKYLNSSDKYNLYIINDNPTYAVKDFIIIAYKDYGVLIKYVSEADNNDMNSNHYLIESMELADSFIDFADNYVPAIISFTKKQTVRFLDELIAKCK